MACVLFLFLARFYVNVARTHFKITVSCFPAKNKRMHTTPLSYVGREGYLYRVFLILAKMRLIYVRTGVKGCAVYTESSQHI